MEYGPFKNIFLKRNVCHEINNLSVCVWFGKKWQRKLTAVIIKNYIFCPAIMFPLE